MSTEKAEAGFKPASGRFAVLADEFIPHSIFGITKGRMTAMFHFNRLVCCFMVPLLLMPSAAHAIFSQPSALVGAGPMRVNVDIEISEAARLLPQLNLRSHIEGRLSAAGIPVMPVAGGEQLPSAMAPQLWVHIAARRVAEPPCHIVSIEVSHLEPARISRSESVPIQGIGWQESWALVVPDDSDLLTATNAQLDSLTDDFIRDYQAANVPATPQ